MRLNATRTRAHKHKAQSTDTLGQRAHAGPHGPTRVGRVRPSLAQRLRRRQRKDARGRRRWVTVCTPSTRCARESQTKGQTNQRVQARVHHAPLRCVYIRATRTEHADRQCRAGSGARRRGAAPARPDGGAAGGAASRCRARSCAGGVVVAVHRRVLHRQEERPASRGRLRTAGRCALLSVCALLHLSPLMQPGAAGAGGFGYLREPLWWAGMSTSALRRAAIAGVALAQRSCAARVPRCPHSGCWGGSQLRCVRVCARRDCDAAGRA